MTNGAHTHSLINADEHTHNLTAADDHGHTINNTGSHMHTSASGGAAHNNHTVSTVAGHQGHAHSLRVAVDATNDPAFVY